MCACLGDSAGDFHLKREFFTKGLRWLSCARKVVSWDETCTCSCLLLQQSASWCKKQFDHLSDPAPSRALAPPSWAHFVYVSWKIQQMYLLLIFFFFLLRGWLNMLFRGELSWEKLKGYEAIRPELLQCGTFNEMKTNGVSMKDVPLLYFASENCWLWLTGVQLQMVSLYGPMQKMSKDQYATQTLLRQNWESNKKSVFNACCDQYSDLVNRVSPWWNRLSAVTKTVCPHVWLLNTLSKVVHTCAHTCEMHRKKVSKDAVHCVKNNGRFGSFTPWIKCVCGVYIFGGKCR